MSRNGDAARILLVRQLTVEVEGDPVRVSVCHCLA
jgi:hypothetical protein